MLVHFTGAISKMKAKPMNSDQENSNKSQLKEKNGEHPLGDTGQLIAFLIFMVIWLTDSFWVKWTTLSAETVPNPMRLTIAIPVWILSGYLIMISHFIVHAACRPAGVVRSGAFRFVRHPVYLSAILCYLGLVISSLSIAALIVWLAIFGFYNFIAAYEEKILIAKFGQEYRDYQRRTGRWLPKIFLKT